MRFVEDFESVKANDPHRKTYLKIKGLVRRLDECAADCKQRTQISDVKCNHYSNCVWADSKCRIGPDSCICCYGALTLSTIESLFSRLNDETVGYRWI